MSRQAALEQQALEQLRKGELNEAHTTLRALLELRPTDQALKHRLQQVEQLIEKHGARDVTARQTALAELRSMTVRTSQYNPSNEVPEKSWMYRVAKRFWFNDFGVYRGHDHSRSSAPGVLAATRPDA